MAPSMPTLADAKNAYDRGDLDQARRLAVTISRTSATDSTIVQALHFAGIVSLDQKNLSEAEGLIRQALVLEPARASALANLAQIGDGILPNASPYVFAFRAALTNPRSVLCLSVLAALYKEKARKHRAKHRFDLALAQSKRALILVPDMAEALRGAVTERRWQSILSDVKGTLDRAAAILERVKQIPPHPMTVLAGFASAATQLYAARGMLFQMPPPRKRPALSAKHEDRINLAFVGSYLSGHALGTALPEIFMHLDQARFRVNVYATPRPSGETEWSPAVEAHASSVTDISSLAPEDQAELMRRRDEHIAIDFNGFLGDPLTLFRHAPAPILVNYFGFPATCGGLHDYIIGDRILIPSDAAEFYGEAIIRLPHSYIPFDRNQTVSERPSRAEYGLPEDGFVLAAHHSQNKTAADAFEAWLSCLRRIPGSVLWLLDHGKVSRDNMTEAAQRAGVDPAKLIFAPLVPRPQHLARLPLADIYLDNSWYNAHTTAVDALWMGLPFVTCTGTAFAARVGASVLHAAGLPDLIAKSPHEMANIAVALAASPFRLEAIRKQLQGTGRNAPLFDMQRYTGDLERAFEAMIERSRQGLPAADIDIRP
ncbi:hypothetical protein NUH88_21615 [Nisaea acidiphila]|uniref:O-GlcNAc transferase C-terminal domain-containing protein n=1 Tax=Nisaea acidiphila TaxID=1862145 RepID=A0A9J7AWZ6_9PROT|nr:hypothetical protein [Nisaea acidiphila]UUX49973.1 hypothetical protein NUH88_21615 [Nisaea acidiphila]